MPHSKPSWVWVWHSLSHIHRLWILHSFYPGQKKLRQPRARGAGAWSLEHARAYVWLACLSQFFLATLVVLQEYSQKQSDMLQHDHGLGGLRCYHPWLSCWLATSIAGSNSTVCLFFLSDFFCLRFHPERTLLLVLNKGGQRLRRKVTNRWWRWALKRLAVTVFLRSIKSSSMQCLCAFLEKSRLVRSRIHHFASLLSWPGITGPGSILLCIFFYFFR